MILECPTSEMLSKYLTSKLIKEEEDALKKHISACEDCKKGVSEKLLNLFLATPECVVGALEQISCLDYEAMDQYLDGKLDEETKSLARNHLEICTLCRDEVESMKNLRESLQTSVAKILVLRIIERLWELRRRKEPAFIWKKCREYIYPKPPMLPSLRPSHLPAFQVGGIQVEDRKPTAGIPEAKEECQLATKKIPFLTKVSFEKDKGLIVSIETNKDEYKDCLVKFSLNEESKEKISGIISAVGGKGNYIIGKNFQRPSDVDYQLRIEVITLQDIMEEMRTKKGVKFLNKRLEDKDSLIKRYSAKILEELEKENIELS